jgi:Tol biopolymer transport system component
MNRNRQHGILAATALVALAGGSALLAPTSPAVAAHLATGATGAATAIDGRIVFNDFQTGELYTANPDGTAVVQVTHVGPDAIAARASWSPDSHRLVFESNLNGEFRVYVMRADGTHRHKITTDRPGFADLAPRYTPDGKRVVFGRCQPDPPGGCAIYSVRADGTHRQPITRYHTGVRQAVDFWPDVSPDGTHLAFTRFEYKGIAAQTWVARIDGSHAHPVTPARLEAAIPDWAPDGRRLLVTSDIAHLGDSIYVVNAFGPGLRKLTHPAFPHNDVFARYSPTGRRIVFASDRGFPHLDGLRVYVMNPDGSGRRVVPLGSQLVGLPDWGSAPLLPASAGTRGSSASTAHRLTARILRRELEPWPGLAARR